MQTKYAKYSEITKTEKEIARLVSLGFSNKKIAKIRSIAPSTVKTHIISVYQKLNIADNAKGNDGSKRVRLVLWYLKQQRKYKQALNEIEKLSTNAFCLTNGTNKDMSNFAKQILNIINKAKEGNNNG